VTLAAVRAENNIPFSIFLLAADSALVPGRPLFDVLRCSDFLDDCDGTKKKRKKGFFFGTSPTGFLG